MAVSALSLLVTACGDGERHYRSGHPMPNTFEVFSFNNPAGEVGGILLYMVLPVAIGTITSFLVLRFRTKRFNSKTIAISLLPRSVMLGILLSSFGYMIGFATYMHGDSSIYRFFLNVAFAGILLAPVLLIVGLTLLIDIFAGRSRAGLPSWILHTASLVGLVAEYFWLSDFGQA